MRPTATIMNEQIALIEAEISSLTSLIDKVMDLSFECEKPTMTQSERAELYEARDWFKIVVDRMKRRAAILQSGGKLPELSQ